MNNTINNTLVLIRGQHNTYLVCIIYLLGYMVNIVCMHDYMINMTHFQEYMIKFWINIL